MGTTTSRDEIAPGRERFAVSLTELGDAGWLVEASGAEEAVATVRSTVPDVGECVRGEFMVWTAERYRSRYLQGEDFSDAWTVLENAPA